MAHPAGPGLAGPVAGGRRRRAGGSATASPGAPGGGPPRPPRDRGDRGERGGAARRAPSRSPPCFWQHRRGPEHLLCLARAPRPPAPGRRRRVNATLPPSDAVGPRRAPEGWNSSPRASLKSIELLGGQWGTRWSAAGWRARTLSSCEAIWLTHRFEPPFTAEHHYEPPRYWLARLRFGHRRCFAGLIVHSAHRRIRVKSVLKAITRRSPAAARADRSRYHRRQARAFEPDWKLGFVAARPVGEKARAGATPGSARVLATEHGRASLGLHAAGLSRPPGRAGELPALRLGVLPACQMVEIGLQSPRSFTRSGPQRHMCAACFPRAGRDVRAIGPATSPLQRAPDSGRSAEPPTALASDTAAGALSALRVDGLPIGERARAGRAPLTSRVRRRTASRWPSSRCAGSSRLPC